MSQATPQIAELRISADPAAWEAVGFEVIDGTVRVGSVLLRLDLSLQRSRAGGVSAWVLSGLPDSAGRFDGLPEAEPGPAVADPLSPGSVAHPNLVTSVDHLVVLSPDLKRTIDAFEAGGVRCRRVREVGPPEQQLRQAFFRFAEVIVEVVEVPEGKAGPDGAAIFWGLTLVVTDLDGAAELLGDKLGAARDAVQPGRRIATVRSEAELGVPVALITPEAQRD